MSLRIRLNGVDYENFISGQLVRSIETVGSAFNLTSSIGVNTQFPIKKGDRVEMLADDSLVLTGFVEKSIYLTA